MLKKILLSLLAITCYLTSNATIYENSIIKLIYPEGYSLAKIENAPHMLVKIISDNSIFTISHWDLNLEENIDIWNDEIYDSYKEGLPVKNAEFVASQKVQLQIKYERLNAIKVYSNMNAYTEKFGTITYLFLKNGDLFVATYGQPAMVNNKTSSHKPESILQNLQIKNSSNSPQSKMSVEEFENYLFKSLKDTNKSLPAKVDEVTTLFAVVNIGKSLVFKYYVDSDIIGYMDKEWEKHYKNTTMLNMIAISPDAELFKTYMARSSIKLNYLFYDKNDNLVRTIQISPTDFN